MILHITKRELYDNLNSLRFATDDPLAVSTDVNQRNRISPRASGTDTAV